MGFAAVALGGIGVVLRRREVGRATTVAAQGAIASIPLLLLQGTSVRMYSLVLCLATLVYLVLLSFPVKWCRRVFAQNAILMALLIAGLVYTSYFAGLLGVGMGCYGVVLLAWGMWKRCDEWRFRGGVVLVGCAVAFVLYLPWLPTVWRLLSTEAGSGQAVVLHWGDRLAFLGDYVLAVCGGIGGGMVVLCGWLGLFAFHRQRSDFALMLVCFVVLPLLLLVFLTPSSRPLGPRYLIFTVPLLWIGAVAGVDLIFKRWKEWRKWQWLVYLPLIAMGLYGAYTRELSPEPDWWEVSLIIEEQAGDDEVILTGGFLSGEALVYHMNEPERFKFLHYVTGMDPFYLACRSPRTVWYVNAAPLPESYQMIVERYFPYSIQVPGNRPISQYISVYAKKEFEMSKGKKAVYRKPVPLPYE